MTRRTHFELALLLALGATALPAAAQDAPAITKASEETSAALPQQEVSDATIQQRIQNQIEKNPALKTQDIQVTVNEGVVTLAGTAPHLPGANRAVAIAEGIRGVTLVKNELSVKRAGGEPVPNEQLEETVMAALRADAATTVYDDVDVTAQEGKVIVAGSVPSPADLELVRSVVSQVQGVENVDLALSVGYSLENRVDELRQEKVNARQNR